MGDLRELLERVEKATGADRELDSAIFSALVDPRRENAYWIWQGSRPQGSPERAPADYWDTRHTPTITSSIDAALALMERMLPGAFWLIGKGKTTALEKMFACQLMFGTDEIIGEGEAETAPLAILAALLRAFIAQDGK